MGKTINGNILRSWEKIYRKFKTLSKKKGVRRFVWNIEHSDCLLKKINLRLILHINSIVCIHLFLQRSLSGLWILKAERHSFTRNTFCVFNKRLKCCRIKALKSAKYWNSDGRWSTAAPTYISKHYVYHGGCEILWQIQQSAWLFMTDKQTKQHQQSRRQINALPVLIHITTTPLPHYIPLTRPFLQ